MKENTSAFPIFDEVTGKIFPGMTLRDYFAGQAIIGYSMENWDYGDTAKSAYELADAVLAERTKN